MNVIVEWWEAMTLTLKLFYTIAFISTMALVGQMLLLLFGVGDGDVDIAAGAADVDVGDGGLHVISVRSVIAFLAGFGWTGVVATKENLSIYWVHTISIAVGASFMLGVFYLMKTLHGMGHSGTLDYKNAIGVVGTVYLPIPAKMESPGQVEIMVQGRLVVVTAYTKEDKEISSQTKVKVLELLDQQSMIVEPLSVSKDHN